MSRSGAPTAARGPHSGLGAPETSAAAPESAASAAPPDLRSRVALTVPGAAAALGLSADSFARHVAGELRLLRVGRSVRVPVRELERWAERSAALDPRAPGTATGARLNAPANKGVFDGE